MGLLRVDASRLLGPLRGELVALLRGLSAGEWLRATACPGWSVHGVACHLLGVELGNVSMRRDQWAMRPEAGEDLDSWLNTFNQQWVAAAQRVSPELLIQCLELAGGLFEEYAAGLDLDTTGGPVDWATGAEPAPVWLDVAREYMERYVHQAQIRDATGRPALGPELTGPVLTTAAHALPRALRHMSRPLGTSVTFSADGPGGGTWYVVRGPAGWVLADEPTPQTPACEVSTSVAGALRLYARDPAAPPLAWRGDPELADTISGVKAVLG